MDVTIKPERDHYVVYIDNKFFCTSDTYSEVAKEVRDFLLNRCY